MKNADAEHQLRIIKILWAVFLVSQVSFLAALFLARRDLFHIYSGEPFLGETPIAILIFAFLAFTNLMLSFLIKSLAVKKAIEEQNVKLIQTAAILGSAFCESISIMGLILALAFHYQYFFLWFALGIFGIILHFPRRADVFAASCKKP